VDGRRPRPGREGQGQLAAAFEGPLLDDEEDVDDDDEEDEFELVLEDDESDDEELDDDPLPADARLSVR
jgi:hypothetical protein